jgi:molecular chaperone GrpE
MILLSSRKYKNKRFIIDETKETIPISDKELTANSSSTTDLIDEITEQLQKLQSISKPGSKATVKIQDSFAQDIAMYNLISDLVPIMDSMERTLELANTFPDNEILKNWLTNISAINRKLRNILFRQGLQEVETIGKLVDFNEHEVVEYREINNYPENTIIEEKQKGYLFRGKVIRDAKVVVAKPAIKSL